MPQDSAGVPITMDRFLERPFRNRVECLKKCLLDRRVSVQPYPLCLPFMPSGCIGGVGPNRGRIRLTWRECVDYVVIFGEVHLRRVLSLCRISRSGANTPRTCEGYAYGPTDADPRVDPVHPRAGRPSSPIHPDGINRRHRVNFSLNSCPNTKAFAYSATEARRARVSPSVSVGQERRAGRPAGPQLLESVREV